MVCTSDQKKMDLEFSMIKMVYLYMRGSTGTINVKGGEKPRIMRDSLKTIFAMGGVVSQTQMKFMKDIF